MLSEEQISKIKSQIISQIDSTFPEDQKQSAKEQIEAMNSEQLEQFLEQNNLSGSGNQDSSQQKIFRSIVSGEIPSLKINENPKAIAVLEINPISKGHTIIIPREPITKENKIIKTIYTLAEEISKKIKTKLKPKDILISPSNLFGEVILNVIPVYENETINSERSKASQEELQELQGQLETKQIKKPIKKPKPKILKETEHKLPRRIP